MDAVWASGSLGSVSGSTDGQRSSPVPQYRSGPTLFRSARLGFTADSLYYLTMYAMGGVVRNILQQLDPA